MKNLVAELRKAPSLIHDGNYGEQLQKLWELDIKAADEIEALSWALLIFMDGIEDHDIQSTTGCSFKESKILSSIRKKAFRHVSKKSVITKNKPKEKPTFSETIDGLPIEEFYRRQKIYNKFVLSFIK